MDENGKVIGILTSGIDKYSGGIYNYAQRINDILPQISQYVKVSEPEEIEEGFNLTNIMWVFIITIFLIIIIILILLIRKRKK